MSMTTQMSTLTQVDDVVLAQLVDHDGDLALAEVRSTTAEAREAIWQAAAAVERAGELVGRLWDLRAHEVMIDAETGQPYGSWKRFCGVELLGLRSLKIAVEDRLQLVAALVDRGVSRRGAAESLGVSEGTVRLDLKKLEPNPNPAPSDPLELEFEGTTKRNGARQIEAAPAQRRTRVEQTSDALHAAGPRGLTTPELARLVPDAPDPSAILSELHASHRIQRLSVEERSGTRAGFAVYVAHTHEAGRDVEAPGRRSRRRTC